MEIIITIVVGLFAVAGIIVLVKVNRGREKTQEAETVSAPVSDCCGAHEICDFDELKADVTRIEYYDDEELDEYKNIKESAYTNSQIDQFREILYTLKTSEIRYWLLSIERRHINLPSILMSEARMLMAEG
ncbi:hypothetical protein MASR2M47_45410 [Draconibacterium sp.]|jgi:hypothetical protein